MIKLAIGIDIGGTMTKIGLVDLDGFNVLEIFLANSEKIDADKFISNLIVGIDALKEKYQLYKTEILGIGIGVSGFVFEDGTVDSTYGFQQFMEDYPLAAIMQKLTGMPCKVDNDARLVVLGEALAGKAAGYERVLGLTLGTGLGVGFVNRGRLGNDLPFAHMAGHMTIRSDGPKCYCGKTGCLESLVSASGLFSIAKNLNWFDQNPKYRNETRSLFEAAVAGNEGAQQIVGEFIQDLKTGLSNLINGYAPDRVILGGGLSKNLGPYLTQLGNLTDLPPFKKYKVSICISELEEKAGVIGSAALLLKGSP